MAEHNFSVENTLTLLLDDKKYHSLRDILSTMNPADIAAVFDELPESRLPLLFRLLPKELAAETFVEMDTDAQALLIRGFSDSELKEVIDELYVDDAVDIVEEMPANVVQRILTQAGPRDAQADQRNPALPRGFRRLDHDDRVRFPAPEHDGRRSDSAHPPHGHRQRDDLHLLRHQGGHKLHRSGVGQGRCFCVKTTMHRSSPSWNDHVICRGHAGRPGARSHRCSRSTTFWHCRWSITENRLVGIVTFDDAMDVMQDEATEDMEKMAAMLPVRAIRI